MHLKLYSTLSDAGKPVQARELTDPSVNESRISLCFILDAQQFHFTGPHPTSCNDKASPNISFGVLRRMA